MDHRPIILLSTIGRESAPLVIIDDFASNADKLRATAATTPFTAASVFYPGIRANLPEDYLPTQLPVIARALGRAFGPIRNINVIDASFAMVTTSHHLLSPNQRLPHVDGYRADRIALIHYLSPAHSEGTAFFRHRATGFEQIGADRAAAYHRQIAVEGETGAEEGYIAGDTERFELIERIEARFNRALLYRSASLHSGAITRKSRLSDDPIIGRLTVAAFLSVD